MGRIEPLFPSKGCRDHGRPPQVPYSAARAWTASARQVWRRGPYRLRLAGKSVSPAAAIFKTRRSRRVRRQNPNPTTTTPKVKKTDNRTHRAKALDGDAGGFQGYASLFGVPPELPGLVGPGCGGAGLAFHVGFGGRDLSARLRGQHMRPPQFTHPHP